MLKFLSLFLILSLSIFAESESLNNREKEIDGLLKTVVTPKACTPQRQDLCNVLNEFQNAAEELPLKIKRTFTLGRIFSAHINFKQTWEYGRTWSVAFLEKEDDKLKLDTFRMESETEQEIADSKALISQIEKGEITPENSSYLFLKDLDKGVSLKECNKFERTYHCEGNRNHFNEIYLRFDKGFLYIFAFGLVTKRQGSWDRIPGFYISKLPLPK
ncbi:hypothetical protein [Leptospira kmetyi]|uniref:hypothetical protein n=1 Tax=Leptospira kmetyi TaxID=408139 RepID=UPI0010838B65|nr:hypothetical protein [Leptospira kmetyi]TGL68636.1 hypothetical protein EHQ67_11230 [Leptospira kmetyi]